MVWVRIDDGMSEHPKILAVGPEAAWLFVSGLCYASRNLTDGYIPEGQARRLADIKSPTAAIKRLLEHGLWELADGGYAIHDYDDYNYSADEIKEQRQRNAERQARWRDRKRTSDVTGPSDNSVSNADRNGVTNGPVTLPHTHTHIESSNELSCDDDFRDKPTPRKSRTPDLLFEAVASAWMGEPYRSDLLTRPQSKLVGTVTADLRAVGALPEEVAAEWRRIKAVFDNPTAAALSKHWKADLSAKQPTQVRTEDIYQRLN